MCKDATRDIIASSEKCPSCIDVASNIICLSTDKMSRRKVIVRKDINSCSSLPSGDNEEREVAIAAANVADLQIKNTSIVLSLFPVSQMVENMVRVIVVRKVYPKRHQLGVLSLGEKKRILTNTCKNRLLPLKMPWRWNLPNLLLMHPLQFLHSTIESSWIKNQL